MPSTSTRIAVRVTGVVQGVGFRPFVHRLASELGLVGHVGNDAGGVFLEVEGGEAHVRDFLTRLSAQTPPLASIAEVTTTAVPARGDHDFRIVASEGGGAVATLVPPDVAICDDCRAELFDPSDRRFRHPFITCTNCGPRFTIVRTLPYDRPATTMAAFPMCATCRGEYDDPTDRRFHAQPIACPDCGPTLAFEPRRRDAGVHLATARLRSGAADSRAGIAPGWGPPVPGSDPALAAAARVLASGGTIAVKGVGGFHLACDATSTAAVARLRERKQRPDRPFAVMVADLATARTLTDLEDAEVAALRSPQRPVVLAHRRADSPVTDAVAPGGNPLLGLMLPSSPLHELLLAEVAAGGAPAALVMTSGNLTGEPICFDDQDARQRLGALVDGLLTHDRPIEVPCDDGVVRCIDGEVVPIRRSRGDAPLPLALPSTAGALLAVGGELKNTVGVARGRQAWLSQHVGDLGDLETRAAFERAVAQLTTFYEVEPTHVAVDPHPGYANHAWARRHHGDRLVHVQHHHAHAASLLAEHGLPPDEAIVAVTFDGTGYGEDGTVWGGEFLIADQERASRIAHLATVPLPGGDSAVTNPARMALAHLHAAGIGWAEDLACVTALTGTERRVLHRQLVSGTACVPTSSMGRLFDAVSALLGVCQRITYEGQAAIELEWQAEAFTGTDADAPTYRFAMHEGDGLQLLDPAPLLAAIVADHRAGVDTAAIAAGFHLGVCDIVVRVAAQVAASGGPRTVGLTGGVFQNAWLTTRVRQALESAGATVLTHRRVPANDGGLAYGQLAVLAARLTETTTPAVAGTQ